MAKEAFSYGSHVVGNGFIAIVGQLLKTKSQCVVVNVYAACNLKDKVVLWEALTTLKQSYVNLAWCFCGDFNAVRSEDERKGIRGCSSPRLMVLIALSKIMVWWIYPLSVKSTLGSNLMARLRVD